MDLEEEFSRRILEGVGAALELILAERYVRDLPVIYATFVIKLNSLKEFLQANGMATEDQDDQGQLPF